MANWLVFAGLGPPIGFASLLAAIAVLDGVPPPESAGFLIMIGVPASYIVGIVPALLTAAALRWVQVKAWPFDWFWGGLAGAASGVVLVQLAAVIAGEALFPKDGLLVGVYAIVGLVPALVCWHLSRRLDKSAWHGRE